MAIEVNGSLSNESFSQCLFLGDELIDDFIIQSKFYLLFSS